MAKDHYVARTYLRHFGDDSKGGMLNGYQKPNGTTFSCWPKDVCHEWDGDLNPSVLERSEILGDYRKIFEPNWNPAIEDIVAGKMSATDKFIVPPIWRI